MTKLYVIVIRNDENIRKVFDMMLDEETGISKRAKIKIFKMVYNSKIKALLNPIKIALKKYIVSQDENSIYCEDEGTEEYIEDQKTRIKRFLEADEKELNNNKEYRDFKNDRNLKSLYRLYRSKLEGKLGTITKKALRGSTIKDFYSNLGIEITLK